MINTFVIVLIIQFFLKFCEVISYSNHRKTKRSHDMDLTDRATVEITANRDLCAPLEMGGKHKHSKERAILDPLSQNITAVAQICMLLYIFIVVYLCFNDEFIFFTWHPLLLSTGWMFFMLEGMLVLSKENPLTSWIGKSTRLQLHWTFQTAALILNLTGFLIVFLNKNYLNKQHFKTWHALFGLVAIISSSISCLNGLATFYGASLKNYIRPKIVKCFHVCSGACTLGFGGLSILLSVYTKWFNRHTNGSIIVFCLCLVIVGIAVTWTFVKPVKKAYNKLKQLLY